MNRSQNILMLGLSLTGIVASNIKHDDNEFNDEHNWLCHYFCLNTIFCSGSTAAPWILVESSRISLWSMLFSRFHCREGFTWSVVCSNEFRVYFELSTLVIFTRHTTHEKCSLRSHPIQSPGSTE